MRPVYSNVAIWWLKIKQRLRELLISLSKSKRALQNNEMAESEQKLEEMVVSLSCGKKFFTEYKNAKCEIRQRQIKKIASYSSAFTSRSA